MDFLELDENTLRNNSFKRNINQLFEIFFEDTFGYLLFLLFYVERFYISTAHFDKFHVYRYVIIGLQTKYRSNCQRLKRRIFDEIRDEKKN